MSVETVAEKIELLHQSVAKFLSPSVEEVLDREMLLQETLDRAADRIIERRDRLADLLNPPHGFY